MKISVIGLFRDSEKHISQTLSALENLSKIGEFDFYFYENDSIDNTKSILSNWLSSKNGELISETLSTPKFGSVTAIQRLVFLSYYRNKARYLLNKSESKSKYSLLIDTDVFFTNEHFLHLYNFLEANPDAAMVVANTRQDQVPDLLYNDTKDSFHDAFTLKDEYNNNSLYFTDCPFVLKKHRDLWYNNNPIRIQSGFGGFSLVKTDLLRKKDCYWSTCGSCEHVNFCYSISKYGDIYLLPYCRPVTPIDPNIINIDNWEKNAKQQINYIKNINYIYHQSTHAGSI
jgi:hypothetical protein